MSYKVENLNKIDFSDVSTGEKLQYKGLHPGRFLKEGFLEPLEMSQYKLAKLIGIAESRVSDLVTGKTRMSAEVALRLEKLWGLNAGYWLRLQDAFDIRNASHQYEDSISHINRMEIDYASVV